MSRTTALRAFMMGAPLAFAALLMQHPTGAADDFYSVVAQDPARWLTVHYLGAIFFPLMAGVIWLLVRDLPGPAATVTRVALPIYAVSYAAFEALMGIASGVLAQDAQGMSGADRQGVIDVVNGIATHPIVGESGVFSTIGGGAWLTAMVAAVIALRHAGVRTPALILLSVSAMMAMHVPPFGPIALVCLSGAAFLIERGRVAVVATKLRPAPAS